MYDYGLSTLEQYELTVVSTSRVRGALLCRTEQGLFILKEFRGSEKKLKQQQELLLSLEACGSKVDSFVPNREGELISRDKDEIPYTLARWYEGRECDTKSREDIFRSMKTLAGLHKNMKLPLIPEYMEKSLEEEYVRHNQELRKIRKFIRRKGASNTFEKDYLSGVEGFLQKGEKALEMLRSSSYDRLRRESVEEGKVCHGEYNQHNVLMLRDGIAVTNFSHWGFDVQMADLYRFMRKIMEKYGWDISLAREMLLAYHREKRITPEEWENLRVRFTYPEKYWKLANYYYSHNKAWISEKNVEKLRILMKQKDQWETFTETCFEKYPY